MSGRFLARFLILSAGLPACPAASAAPQAGQPSLIQIRVVEGDGAINSIRLHRAHDPVVQVVDHAGKAVPGATVTFLLPAFGAGGTFQDNGLSLTVGSDDEGMAAGHGLRPNRAAGKFQIRVTAAWNGQAASATITETNAEPVGSSGHSKKIAILVLIGGAAAAGAAIAAHGGSSNGNNSANSAGGSGATIVAGSPSFGPPH